MATNKYNNKIVYGGEVLIDLTGDTVTPDKLASGITAHDKSGAPITGTNTYDSDTSDATADAGEILNGETAYVAGAKVTGTMPNRGSQKSKITTKAQSVTIQNGYHDGSGNVEIDATEQAKIVAGNIKQGITILGVTGTLSPASDVKVQPKTATPTKAQQVIVPDSGFDYLTQVTVAAVPYVETDNASGGKTVTIL